MYPISHLLVALTACLVAGFIAYIARNEPAEDIPLWTAVVFLLLFLASLTGVMGVTGLALGI